MIKIGRISAVKDNKARVVFVSDDNKTTPFLPILQNYQNAVLTEPQIDDTVAVVYTDSGAAFIIGKFQGD